MKKTISMTILTLALAGCAGKTGHQFLEKLTPAEASQKLIKGQTTKDQVLSHFGEPKDIDLRDDGSEVWLYEFKRSEAKAVNFMPVVGDFYHGTNDTGKKLKIMFDKNCRVKSYAFSNAQGETKKGLFQ